VFIHRHYILLNYVTYVLDRDSCPISNEQLKTDFKIPWIEIHHNLVYTVYLKIMHVVRRIINIPMLDLRNVTEEYMNCSRQHVQ
jgi:hypothetical protein